MSRVHAATALLPRTYIIGTARMAIVTACALALALAGPVLPQF